MFKRNDYPTTTSPQGDGDDSDYTAEFQAANAPDDKNARPSAPQVYSGASPDSTGESSPRPFGV